MPQGSERKTGDIAAYLDERIKEIEKHTEAAGTSFRETAKWIISGIALATAGVIAGTSLSSLGTLGVGWRLFAAIAALVIGYVGLGFLFLFALAVIAPRERTLQDVSAGRGMPVRWRTEIEEKARPVLKANKFETLAEFCNFAENPKHGDDSKLSEDEMRNFNMIRRTVGAVVKAVERELEFRRLKYRTFAITPVIALAAIVFAWAANPAKETRVPTMDMVVAVNQNDAAVLRNALGSAGCVGSKLHVIVLGEWPSGVQDVVTVPAPSCPPVRLRLDHGRFSPSQ